MFRKICACFICFTVAAFAWVCPASAATDPSLILTVTKGDGNDYAAYRARYAKEKGTVPEIICSADLFARLAGETYMDGGRLITKEGSVASGEIVIEQAGLYRIGLRYTALDDSNEDIVREITIDGELPFSEAKSIGLSRVWKNETDIQQDESGNDLFQSQVQAPVTETAYLCDSDGYYNEAYLFYLGEGTHTISLNAVQGSIAMEALLLCGREELPTYEQKLREYREAGLAEVKGNGFIKIQAEDMTIKSSAKLAAVSDRSSAALEPAVEQTVRLNILGGGRFSKSGQWVEYTLPDIEEDGLYRLIFKVKQNGSNGINIARTVYINGEIPFAEAKNFEFGYSSSYKNVQFGDESGAWLVHLNKGENTIRIEATLGKISEFCRRVQNSLDRLNAVYRQLVTVTGTSPDIYRDYDIQLKLPEVVKTFGEEAETLKEIAADMSAAFRKTSSYTATIESAVVLLSRMHKDPYVIPANVAAFSSNLSSLGGLISDMKQTDMNMDYFIVAQAGAQIPAAEAGFFRRAAFALRQMAYSFVTDYNNLGGSDADGRAVTAWIVSGRDQTQVLRQIIDSNFTPKTGIGVKLRLVSDVNTLLQATLAGVGPDVALNIPNDAVMNFAFRGALANLAENDDIASVTGRFLPGSVNTVSYREAIYGIPQTCTYPVLFYRKDVLDELNLTVPETWDDVYRLLPVLTQNNMSFGLPTSDITNGSKAGVSSYGMLLYQAGGSFYSEDRKTALFDSETAIEAMRVWTELYSGYGMPVSYNFANRFASGEMPLAIADYSSSFNTLVVFAPQIANLWSFTVVPGTVRADGTVDHTVPITVSAGVMMDGAVDRDAAWEFLKWWSDDETQADFGTFLESLLGPAGRYATANTQVVPSLSWSRLQYRNLALQAQSAVGIPEVAGGYFTWRFLDNSFREIIDDSADVREVMYQCGRAVNEEMRYQREALHLE